MVYTILRAHTQIIQINPELNPLSVNKILALNANGKSKLKLKENRLNFKHEKNFVKKINDVVRLLIYLAIYLKCRKHP